MGNLSNEEGFYFCDDCPFVGDVKRVNNLVVGDCGWAPNPGIPFAFENAKHQQTNVIRSTPTNSFDSTMIYETGRAIIDAVKACDHPEEESVKRLGGLLGRKIVEQCGAFPGQDPSKPVVKTQTNAWMFDY